MHSLALALTAFQELRTPGAITSLLKTRGIGGLEDLYFGLPSTLQRAIDAEAADLRSREINVVVFGDEFYPDSLVNGTGLAAPILFTLGNRKLLDGAGVGMCGARNAGELGLKAASSCGEQVAYRKLSVISGYAKGVDTETHLAALRTGGQTVVVLAEGINHFRVKRSFGANFDLSRILVLSQFPPRQPWGAYAAMARNKIIFGLGRALVVIEAGERGGTLAAGAGALKMGRPVYVLDFGKDTPVGNQILLDAGARPITSVRDLGTELDSLVGSITKPDGLF